VTSQSKFQLVQAENVWSGGEGWDALRYYNYYRLGLAIVLIALASPNFNVLTTSYDSWTLISAIIGFTVAAVVAFGTIKRQSPAIHVQAHTLFLLDMVFISFLTFSRDLPELNIIVFFITTIAATAVIFRTKTALAYAAIATLIIYFRDLLELIRGEISLNQFYFTALTAIVLFGIVLIVSRIAKQTRVVQNVLEQQELDLADLDEINQIIIDNLDVGILFLDDDLSIKLINESARELVGGYIKNTRIRSKLGKLLSIYMKIPSDKQFSFRNEDKVLSMSTIPMRSGVLVRIEDRTTLSRKIQQTKLASLGRFASAISHEIRNPLNAISHAAQLMQPGEKNSENNELVEIIRKHVKRIDSIVESVLDHSRPGNVKQKEIHLRTWLNDFIDTFRQSIGEEEVYLVHSGESISVYFDPTQLEQILTNLCQNSIKYGKASSKLLEIYLVTGVDKDGMPYLNVMNNGAAIPDEIVDNLFEPFYTTHSRSTGLGLYLSKEFCMLNGAEFEYFNDTDSYGFRITFKLQETI